GEAVAARRRALVEDRPEAVTRMPDEIRERHLAGQDESNGPSEEAEEEECAADDLDDPGKPDERADWGDSTARQDRSRKREPLRRTDLEVEKGNDDSEDAQQLRCPLLFHRASIFFRKSSRSRAFWVSDAARASSARASSKRPSFARRSPRTLGSK